MDLVLPHRSGRIACVEVKFSAAPNLTKGFFNALTDLGPESTIVTATVERPSTREGRIQVTNLAGAIAGLEEW
jgi:hypothetical protein